MYALYVRPGWLSSGKFCTHIISEPLRGHKRSSSEPVISSPAIQLPTSRLIALDYHYAATSELSYNLILEDHQEATLAARLAIIMAVCAVGELCAKDVALQQLLESFKVPWKAFVTIRNIIFKPTSLLAKSCFLNSSIGGTVVCFELIFIELESLSHLLSYTFDNLIEHPPDFRFPSSAFAGIKKLVHFLQTKDPRVNGKPSLLSVLENKRTFYFEQHVEFNKSLLKPSRDSSWLGRLDMQPDERHSQEVMGILCCENFNELTPYQGIVRSATTLIVIQLVRLCSRDKFKIHLDSEVLSNHVAHLSMHITDPRGYPVTREFFSQLFSNQEVWRCTLQLFDWKASEKLKVTQVTDRKAATGVSVYIKVLSEEIHLDDIHPDAIDIFKASVSKPDILADFRAHRFDQVLKALNAEHSCIDINTQDHDGNTLLHLILKDADQLIQQKKILGVTKACFKQKGLQLGLANYDGLTPICLFSDLSSQTKGKLRQILCEELIEMSVMKPFLGSDFINDPDQIVDPRGEYTLLHIVGRKGHSELAEFLLSCGANPLLLCKFGNLPIDLARLKGHPHTIFLLEEATERVRIEAPPMAKDLPGRNHRPARGSGC